MFCKLLSRKHRVFNQTVTFTFIHLRARLQFHLYRNNGFLFAQQLGSHQVENQKARFKLRETIKRVNELSVDPPTLTAFSLASFPGCFTKNKIKNPLTSHISYMLESMC
jgi:hypothetical protein